MGFTSVNVKISNPVKADGMIALELLVDTGALYTVVSSERLEKIEIPRLGKRMFKTADGRIVERSIGEALMNLKDELRHVPIAFGEAGDVEVLGVTALEIFGFEVDPITKELKPATLLLV